MAFKNEGVKEVKLKVGELTAREEAGKGIVRIDSKIMQMLGIKEGDVVEVEGKRKTGAIAIRAYPADVGLGIIRMDGYTRRNCGAGVGDYVIVRKADVKEARKVVLAPAEKGVVVRVSPEALKQNLYMRPVTKGDIVVPSPVMRGYSAFDFLRDFFGPEFDEISFSPFGGTRFIVTNTDPPGIVRITDKTVIEVLEKMPETLERRIPAVTYEDIGGMKDVIQKVREMIELPLRHPELFERLGIEPPKGVLLYGPPGTGKTLLAKAVANESGAYFISISGPEIMSKFYGESLPYEEKILIRENGEVKFEPIGKIVESGRKNVEVACFDENFRISFKPISRLIKHKLTGKLLEIRTKSGRKVVVTDYHSLFTVTKDGIRSIKTSYLKPGDFIAIPRVLPESSNPTEELDLLKILKKNDYGLRVRPAEVWKFIEKAAEVIGWKGVSRILEVKKRYLYDIKSKNIGIRVSKFLEIIEKAKIELSNEEKRKIWIYSKRSKIPAILPLSKELLFFFGYWIAEGSYARFEPRLSLNSEEAPIVAAALLKHFDKIGIYKSGKSVDVIIFNTALGKVMKALGFVGGAKKKEIPSFVFNLSKEKLSYFLRGFISGDGTLNTKTYAPQVEITTYSKKLADQLLYLLLYFGIVAKIYEEKDGRNRICFSDTENLRRFLEIGFISAKRNEIIRKYVESRKWGRLERLPTKVLTEEISSYKSLSGIGKNVLLRKEISENLRKLLEGEIFFDEIVKIKKVKKSPKFVYDVEVEGVHNFIGGFGGIILHNSEANLRKVFEEAEKNAPAIIFIDEIDAIAPKREEVTGEVERRVVSQLLTLMDGLKSRGKVIVIGATNRPNALDPALRRPGRFDREIEVPVPDRQGRIEILQIHTRNMPIDPPFTKENVSEALKRLKTKFKNNEEMIKSIGELEKALEKVYDEKKIREICKTKGKKIYHDLLKTLKDILLEELADRTYGYVGADLAALCKEAAMSALRRVLPEIRKLREDESIPKSLLEKLVVTKEDFENALKIVQPSAMREVFVEIPKVRWSDIGDLEEAKQQLKEMVEWPLKYPQAFERLGIEPPRGILLYGPPGTGKTLLAKAVANESGANFISVKGPELLSKWFGESEQKIRELFRRARQVAPCIIFFDEIDAMAPRRGLGMHEATERIVSQLLTEMSGIEETKGVIVIAATNRPDLLDPALLRPGRLDKLIYVPPPDENGRYEIFKIHTRNMPLAKDVDLKELARRTEGYTGADIEAVCKEAALNALREDIKAKEVKMEHFEKALKKIGPSVTKDMVKYYEKFEERRKKIEKQVVETKRPEYIG